jgi:hypothetical protein
LHRLGLEYHKPNVNPRKPDEEKQKAFIESYEKLLNSMGDDEACCLLTPCVRPMPHGPSAAGAGVNASTFTARSTWRPGKPDDRGPDHRRRLDDQVAAIDRPKMGATLRPAGGMPMRLIR